MANRTLESTCSTRPCKTVASSGLAVGSAETDATRTRTSFEIAGKRLSADVVNFSPSSSSLTKAESILDTAMTLDALKKAGVPVFAYGSFITILINFIILAFIIFMMVKQINRLKQQTPPAPAVPAAPPEDIQLLREIRDSLKK